MPTSITEPTGSVAIGDGSLEYALSGLLFTLSTVKTGSGVGWSHNTKVVNITLYIYILRL